jgi:hypothetical protein
MTNQTIQSLPLMFDVTRKRVWNGKTYDAPGDTELVVIDPCQKDIEELLGEYYEVSEFSQNAVKYIVESYPSLIA